MTILEMIEEWENNKASSDCHSYAIELIYAIKERAILNELRVLRERLRPLIYVCGVKRVRRTYLLNELNRVLHKHKDALPASEILIKVREEINE